MPLFRTLPGFPLWLRWYRSTCNAGDLGPIPGLGRPPGEGEGYPLQCSGLEDPMDWKNPLGSPRVGHDGATFTCTFSLLWLLRVTTFSNFYHLGLLFPCFWTSCVIHILLCWALRTVSGYDIHTLLHRVAIQNQRFVNALYQTTKNEDSTDDSFHCHKLSWLSLVKKNLCHLAHPLQINDFSCPC